MERLTRDFRRLIQEHRDRWPYVVGGFLVICVGVYALTHENTTYVYRNEGKPEYRDAKVLGSRNESLYEGKERILSKVVRDLQASQASLKETQSRLQSKLDELEKAKLETPQPLPSPDGHSSQLGAQGQRPGTYATAPGGIVTGPGIDGLDARRFDHLESSAASTFGFGRNTSGRAPGPQTISFPVKEVAVDRTENIVIPPGSYVKAKLMTGVEAPEGKTYPVLLQLDYAYIVPNKHRLDLSGCFMIAKSTGNLSIERVEMQATKLSCVSKDGRMFEREVAGFIADDKDNSFAVMGSVNSKQDRVAAMAFLSSVVKGVGSALQQAQTSTQSNSGVGGQTNSTNVTGSQAAYIAGGGASEAAGQVTQWYLKQAQNLLPTINIGSGQDVWVIMQETVKLPQDYFRKPGKGESNDSFYTYISRLGDSPRP